VFCSRRLPAIIYRQGGVLETDVLSYPPAGFEEAAFNIYAAVCHPGADAESPDFRRFGYSFRTEPPVIHIERPEDIFRYAR
jgi:hypothetical protein